MPFRALKEALAFRGGEPRGPSVGAWLVIALVVELFGLALWPRVPLAPWLGPAVLVAVAVPALARVGSGRAPWLKSLVEYGVVLAVLAGITWVVWGYAIRDRIPIDTGDNQIMFERAKAQVEALRAGRWLRWTNYQQGGDSLTDLYPFLVNLLLFFVHALTKRGTPLIESYTIFVALAWWIRLAATYALARRFGGIAVAFLLAVASGFDVGNDVWDGAWHGAIYWGMVHSNVALSVAMLAMAAQVDLARAFTPGRLIVCAVSVALAAFAHPLGIMVAGATTVAYVVGWLGARELRKETLWVVVASALGLLLAAPWILSFALGQKQFGFNNAMIGISLQDLGAGLYTGATPNSSFRAWTGFVLIAIVGSLLTRDPTLVAPALSAVLFLFLPVMELMIEAGTFSLMPGLLDGQQRRMLTVAKCVATPAAAWLFQLAVGRYLAPTSLGVRRVATRALLLLVLAVGFGRLVAVGGASLLTELRGQVEEGSGAKRERSHTGKDYNEVFARLAATRAADPSPTPFRVAIDWYSVIRHAAWGEGFATKVPVVDFVNAAANFLRIRPREVSEQGFHDWNIRFFITDRHQAPFAHLTERLQSGRFTLWELDTYDDRFVVAPPGVEISGLRVDEGRVQFDVRGAGPDGAAVTVRSAWYPRWRANKKGRDLHAVDPHPGAKPGQEQIGLRVQDGRVVLNCNGPMPGERPGYALSLFGLVGLVGLASSRHRARARELLGSVWGRVRGAGQRVRARAGRRAELGAALGVGALCLLLVYWGFGRRDLMLSPPFVPGPTIEVGTSRNDAAPCERSMLTGMYTCPRTVTVYSTFGSIPIGDDSGEFPRVFAATGVNYGIGKGTFIRLVFSGVAVPDGRLELRYETSVKVRVELRVAGLPVGERHWSGNGTDPFNVPAKARESVELLLFPSGPGALNIARIYDN